MILQGIINKPTIISFLDKIILYHSDIDISKLQFKLLSNLKFGTIYNFIGKSINQNEIVKRFCNLFFIIIALLCSLTLQVKKTLMKSTRSVYGTKTLGQYCNQSEDCIQGLGCFDHGCYKQHCRPPSRGGSCSRVY